MSRRLAPVHPGGILRDEFLTPMELSAYSVAGACGVPRTRIERLAREETPVTADTALRLAEYFGTTPAFWMNLQARYDLEVAEDSNADELKRIKPRKPKATWGRVLITKSVRLERTMARTPPKAPLHYT
jgi:addiction module HigA family antidote